MIRIGYPCMNTSVGCSTAGTFRITNYSEDRFREKVGENLACLDKIIDFNIENDIYVYRVSSNLIPYASHPVQTVRWQEMFGGELAAIGAKALAAGIRLSTHPGQFVLINAPREEIVASSVRELEYQTDLLDLMGAGPDAKVQIHVGGVYGDKPAALDRFVSAYGLLPERVRSRLVIENDERLFTLEDCMELHARTGVPVLFDAFHHSINPGTLDQKRAFLLARSTWKESDGVQQMDFSQQDPEKQVGAHSQSVTPEGIQEFLDDVRMPSPLDIMLEVKDKEQSVLTIRTALGGKVG
jgi:UV DNA damage endonuclease